MLEVPGDVELGDSENPEHFKVDKILQWRWSSKTGRQRREFLVLWQGYHSEDAERIPESYFSDQDALYADLQAGRIEEGK